MTGDKSMAMEPGQSLSKRQRHILSAVIVEHIKTTRPVGSRALAVRYGLEVSSATIRNEMAELDCLGYLSQPHTSAGRVPSAKAYRFHVNHLAKSRKLPLDKLSWIHSQYRRIEREPAKILRTTAKLLADVVRHPAVALEPSSESDWVEDIQARPVSAHAVRVTCSYSGDRQQEFVVRSTNAITAEQVEQLDQLLTAEYANRSLSQIAAQQPAVASKREVIGDLMRVLHGQLSAGGGGDLYVEGTAYILEEPEFQELSRLQAMVQTLGEPQALRELLVMGWGEGEVRVFIGSEHSIPDLEQCSSVMSSFTGSGNRLGILGVVGPMRMEYREIISAVDCVARQVEEVLGELATG